MNITCVIKHQCLFFEKKKVWYWMCFVPEKKMSHSNHVGFARHMQTAQKFKQTIEIIAFVYNF